MEPVSGPQPGGQPRGAAGQPQPGGQPPDAPLFSLRAPAAFLATLEPYDPRYLRARCYLNANESPYAMSLIAIESLAAKIRESAVNSDAQGFNRYPVPLGDSLRQRLAEKTGLLPAQVLLGNGGDELILDLVLAWGGPGRQMLIAPPCFSTYELSAALNGTAVQRLWRGPGLGLDEGQFLAAAATNANDIIVLASPNNPTGDGLSLGFVEGLLASTDALVLIDQAYLEFAPPERDLRPLLARYPNLAILRTFSKAWGLAGLRIGYLLASEQVISELIKVRQPYSVDSLSVLAAEAVYDDEIAYSLRIAEIVAERERLLAKLRQLPGIEAIASEANFFLLRLPTPAAARALWQCLYDEHGILLRDFSDSPGLSGCLRVSIGTPDENSSFYTALTECLEYIQKSGLLAPAADAAAVPALRGSGSGPDSGRPAVSGANRIDPATTPPTD